MDVFLIIRCHKSIILTGAQEPSTAFQLNRLVKVIPEQRLFKADQPLDEGKTLGACGFSSQTARPQTPATVDLAFGADDAFEGSKPQGSVGSAHEQAAQ